jgi:hypothetical protein
VIRIPEGEETEVIIQTADMNHLSTEDCDRILAEHGLAMWLQYNIIADRWFGYATIKTDLLHITDIDTNSPTKRAATEATFLAALEYILKDKPLGV